jgi:hypothetical protein
MLLSRIAILVTFASLIAVAAPAAEAANAVKASKLTRVHEMMSKWRQNRPKLAACRAEARKKGLAGDDRWFFISSCMENS